MSTSAEPLRLNSAELALLTSATPYFNEAELAEAESLLTGQGLTAELFRLRADPTAILTEAGLTPDDWQANFLRSNFKRMLLLCSRQSGKSTVASALALKYALLTPGSLTLLLSPTLRQSGELYRDKVRRLYRGLGRPVETVQESALTMELTNGSRVVSLPGDEDTVSGYSNVALLVIDEASRVTDNLYRTVRPMLAVSGGALIALSTPYGKRGWFYHEWIGDGPWQRVCVTADQCPRISREFLAEELRALGEDWYNQEYNCQFTEGGGNPLFPSEWLDRSAELAAALRGKPRRGVAIGCDPAEGGDMSAWAVVDELGLIALLWEQTPDTSVIPDRTLALMREWNVAAERVVFDRGGGGKQHADELRKRGVPVRTVGFGETVVPDPRMGRSWVQERLANREERYAYKDRRAQMYGELRLRLMPGAVPGFAIPAEYRELRRQLAPIPLTYEGERLALLPKNRREADSDRPTLTSLIGCSPDLADALVLALHGMLHTGSAKRVAGSVG